MGKRADCQARKRNPEIVLPIVAFHIPGITTAVSALGQIL